jgi:hypothetical protein
MTATEPSVEANPIEECMARRDEYREATKYLEKLINSLGKVYATLQAQVGQGGIRNWSIAIVPGGPHNGESSDETVIMADAWPTAQQFNAALSRWESVRFEYRQAWRRIPYNQQRQYSELCPDFIDN